MSIRLSLTLTRAEAPAADPADDDLPVAHADGCVPLAWWALFTPGDAVAGPYGPHLRCRAADALPRLRAAAPSLRAAAGRHALGLRLVEHMLAAHPDRWLHASVHELHSRDTPEQLGQCVAHAHTRLGAETLLVSFDHGRARSARVRLAHLVVGVTQAHWTPLPEPPQLEAAIAAAFDAGDPTDLDLLEEALYCVLEPQLRPYEALVDELDAPPRTTATSDAAELQAQYEAWLDGAPLTGVAGRRAAFVEVVRRARELRPRARQRLRDASDPEEALVAVGVHRPGPLTEPLDLVRWFRGGPPPSLGRSRGAVLACRLQALGAPAWSLGAADPLGLAEAVVHDLTEAPAAAIRRALTLDVATCDWRAETHQPSRSGEALAVATCEALATHPLRPEDRQRLLALPTPPQPALSGAARRAVALALGDDTDLDALLAAGSATAAVVSAIVAAGLGARCAGWLEARAAADPTDVVALDAAAVLVAVAGVTDGVRTAWARVPDVLRAANDALELGALSVDAVRRSFAAASRLQAAVDRLGAGAGLDPLDPALLAAVGG